MTIINTNNTGLIGSVYGTNTTTVYASSHTHTFPVAVRAKPHPLFVWRQSGQRISALDVRLMKLRWPPHVTHEFSGRITYYYKKQTGDVLVQYLGDYNPLYGGKPKALVDILLRCAAGPSKPARASALEPFGLLYTYPSLAGVRCVRYRTSAASLILLDHWAEKYPKFKPFLDAYVSAKSRRQIMSECFDLALGVRPKSFLDADEKNKVYAVKADARRKKKEQLEAIAEAERRATMYRDAVNTTAIGVPWGVGTQGIPSAGSLLKQVKETTAATNQSFLQRLFRKV